VYLLISTYIMKIELNVIMSFIHLIILSNVRITRKQAVLSSFEFISRLPPLTNLISIICAPLISDLFVLHDITFFSSSSHIYIYIGTHLSALIPFFSFYNTGTYLFSFIILLTQKRNDLKNKKKQM
jgi:hypothetical protein